MLGLNLKNLMSIKLKSKKIDKIVSASAEHDMCASQREYYVNTPCYFLIIIKYRPTPLPRW